MELETLEFHFNLESRETTHGRVASVTFTQLVMLYDSKAWLDLYWRLLPRSVSFWCPILLPRSLDTQDFRRVY